MRTSRDLLILTDEAAAKVASSDLGNGLAPGECIVQRGTMDAFDEPCATAA